MRCQLHLKSMVQVIIREETYQIGLVWSIQFTSVHFGPFNLLHSPRFNLVLFGPFSSNSIYFGLFGPFRSHLSNSVYSIHSIHFGPFGLFRSILAHFVLFDPIQCTNLRMTKDKFWLRILSII